MVDSEDISRANTAWFAVFAIWVFVGLALREYQKQKVRKRLRDIALNYAGKDEVTQAYTGRTVTWVDLQEGVERQIGAIKKRVGGDSCGLTLIKANDGSRPFAHLAGVPGLLCEAYERAKRGEEDLRSRKVVNVLIRDSCRESGSPLATVTPHQWSQYERLRASIEELMDVIQFLAHERLLVPPLPPGEYFGPWRL